jgi:hypothetical protein
MPLVGTSCTFCIEPNFASKGSSVGPRADRAVATTEHGFAPGIEAAPIACVGFLHLDGHPVLCPAVDASRVDYKDRLNRAGHHRLTGASYLPLAQ